MVKSLPLLFPLVPVPAICQSTVRQESGGLQRPGHTSFNRERRLQAPESAGRDDDDPPYGDIAAK